MDLPSTARQLMVSANLFHQHKLRAERPVFGRCWWINCKQKERREKRERKRGRRGKERKGKERREKERKGKKKKSEQKRVN